MAGRYGYSHYNNGGEAKSRAPIRPISTAALIQGVSNGNLQSRLNAMMNRDIRGPAASKIQKIARGKYARNAAKAKKEAKRVREQLQALQFKTFRKTDESNPAMFNSRTRRSRKKAKAKRKAGIIKAKAINAVEKDMKKYRARREGALGASALRGLSVAKAKKAASNMARSKMNNTSMNSSSIAAMLPEVPTHIPVMSSAASKNNNNGKIAVAMGGRRRSTRKRRRRRGGYMDRDSIIKILDDMLKLWLVPAPVGLEDDGESTLYKNFVKTKKLYEKLPEKIKTMTVFVPKDEEVFYDVEKFDHGDFEGQDELLIDKDANLEEIMINLDEQAELFKNSSYFRARWWGSPLNLQGQIKSVLEKLKPKVIEEDSYQSEKEVTLGGRRNRHKKRTRKRKKRRRRRTNKRKH